MLSRNFILRWGVSLIALAAFLLFDLVRETNPHLYFRLLNITDGGAAMHPFGDTQAILQAASCWRRGVDVYRPDSCMGGGEYNYAILLLRFLYFIPPKFTNFAAIFIDLLYVASFAFLPKPCGWTEFALRSMAALSGASIYAVERANLDVAIFLLAFAGIILLERGIAQKLFGYAISIFLAAIKFYPLALLFLAVRERLAILCGVAAMVFGAGVMFWALQGGSTATAIKIIPQGYPFGGTFGAIDLFYGFDAFGQPANFARFSFVYSLTSWQARCLHGMELAGFAIAFILSARYQPMLAALDPLRKNFLAAGAVVIAGCFLAAQNVDYRAIFLIWTIPALALLGQQEKSARLLLGAIILAMWEAFFRHLVKVFGYEFLSATDGDLINFGFWLLRNLLWWWIVIQLLAILFAFLRLELKRLAGEIKLTATARNG